MIICGEREQSCEVASHANSEEGGPRHKCRGGRSNDDFYIQTYHRKRSPSLQIASALQGGMQSIANDISGMGERGSPPTNISNFSRVGANRVRP